MLPDTHRLGRLDAGHLLLHRDAGVPWFILVPETEAIDLLDLERTQRESLLDACADLARYLKEERSLPKVNVAAIGNVVPRLHVHVVGRFPGDACWPAPVWGNLATDQRYGPADLEEITEALQRRMALHRE